MATPIRLYEALLSAAEKAGAIQKRSIPKHIEFWAELGKTVEHVNNMDDIFTVIQGVKKIVVEPVPSVSVSPRKVSHSLESARKKKTLSEMVTTASVYYEASQTTPGLPDRVDSRSGARRTGNFVNGEFVAQ
jgi:hypothetical protein